MTTLMIDTTELAEICRRIDDVEYGRVPQTGQYAQDKDRLREIGQAANDADGLRGMFQLTMGASHDYRNAGNTLNHHWHGIGDWRR